jgi:hypothetical protein
VTGTRGLRILRLFRLGLDNPGSSGFVPRSYQFSFIQHLPTSQEEIRPENSTPHAVLDQPCGQGLPAPKNSIQAKKVSMGGLEKAGQPG